MSQPSAVRLLAASEVDYASARDWQVATAAEVRAARSAPLGDAPATAVEALALIEHASVYTMGARGGRASLRLPLEALPASLVDTDRGGDITWHGPGQLVAYPILDLRRRGLGVAEYVATLEGLLLDTLAAFDIHADLVEGRRGVWVGDDKIAALGISVRGGVSLHGVALNVSPDLSWFDAIVPCGLEDAGVTSMSRVLGRTVRVAEARREMLHGFARRFDSTFVTVSCDVAASALSGAREPGVRVTTIQSAPRHDPKPPWFKAPFPGGERYGHIKDLLREERLHTVCEEAHCPNIGECFNSGTATFMILGDTCTRACGYCAITSGKPGALDLLEPLRLAQTVDTLGLDYAVITSVNRDDVPDGGASIFAQCIRAIHHLRPDCRVEVLIPDFGGDPEPLRTVIEAGPAVLNHNTETVPRLYPKARFKGDYQRTLTLLGRVKEFAPELPTKTGIMVGLGETIEELEAVLRDLRAHQVDLVTIGQYLRPTPKHLPVARFLHPEEFAHLKQYGMALGFAHVESGPLVRSSYHAGEQESAARVELTGGNARPPRAGQ